MRTRLQHKHLWSAVLTSTILMASNAQAAFVMILDDPNDTYGALTIFDGSGNDLNGVNGVITYSGSVGAFIVNVTTGISKPLIGPAQLDLNSINVSGATGVLQVSISDTDYEVSPSALIASYGGTTQGMVDFSFLYDDTNQAFGGSAFAIDSVATSPGNLSFGNDLTGSITPAALFSLSILATITHGSSNQVTSFDAAISPIPIPASIWLFGSALAGLVALRRRVSN